VKVGGVEKRVAIIGAGAAGLITAKVMLQAGLRDLTVFETGSDLGGLWNYGNDSGSSVAYRTLHINTDTEITQLSDFPFAKGVAPYAHHTEMLGYLRSFADHFGVTERIRFSTTVTRVTPGPDGAGWIIETSDGDTESYDSVIVATGHLHSPRLPELPGTFDGTYVHSAAYREPLPYAGQRVCVIGLGNSACDIANDLSTVASRLVVSSRTGTVIWPKFVFGYPLTRLAAKFTRVPLVPPALASRAFKAFNRVMVWAMWGSMESYGITPPERKTHPTSNQFFLSHVKYGRIEIKPSISAISGSTMTFADGTSEDFDAVIAATGYTVAFPFLDPALIGNDDTHLPLYKRVVPPEHRGLYLIGYFNLDWASNPVYERQASWVADIELGRCDLPDRDAMWADVKARDEQIAREFISRPRLNLEVEYVPYMAELARARTYRRRRQRPARARLRALVS
jgi:dimethylaniline monooxygenase (N-oxide forming)